MLALLGVVKLKNDPGHVNSFLVDSFAFNQNALMTHG